MPTPSQQSSRVPVFLLLVGAAGLLASGAGVLPGAPAWVWLAVLALGAALPLARTWAGARAFDSEERLANDRAREGMKWSMERQDRRLQEMGDTVAKMEEHALKPGEAPVIRQTLVNFAADLQQVKAEIVEMREAEKMRRFGTTFGGQPPEGT